jgi:acyl carrier protein
MMMDYNTELTRVVSRKTLELVKMLMGFSPHDNPPISLSSTLVGDCKFDSLDLVEIVMMVEDEWNIQVDDAAGINMTTVGDLVKYVMYQKHGYPWDQALPLAEDEVPPQYVPVGTASPMPGTSGGFTFVCFVGSEVPVGTEVFVRVLG